MYSDKMSKCCFDLFKIYSRYTKRQVIVSLHVITKVFLLRHSNVSLENGKKLCVHCPVPKENHDNAKGSAS